jgi:DNA-binding NarL/FixJ family response regulator
VDTKLELQQSRRPPAIARTPENVMTVLDLDVRNRPVGRETASTTTINVAVLADDQLTGQGAVAALHMQPGLRVLPTGQRHQAEVVVIMVGQVTDRTLAWMQSEAAATDGNSPKFVLVGDGVREHHMLRAVSHGLISVLPRRDADFDRIAQAVRDAHDGLPGFPAVELGWLIKQIRAVQLDVLAPNGLSPNGFETRELDVLGLLADGLDTADIALRLNFSERTVKNIIHGLLTRLGLRNRAHAVSFALRNNLL